MAFAGGEVTVKNVRAVTDRLAHKYGFVPSSRFESGTPTLGFTAVLSDAIREALRCEPVVGVMEQNAWGGAMDSSTQAATRTDAIFFAFQVDTPAALALESALPAYPARLRPSGLEGDVLIQLVVDTSGRGDAATFKVLRATDSLFAASVRRTVPNLRFHPAIKAGRRVQQVVQQRFVFSRERSRAR